MAVTITLCRHTRIIEKKMFFPRVIFKWLLTDCSYSARGEGAPALSFLHAAHWEAFD